MSDILNALHQTLSNPWVIFGFCGQFLFTMRFVIQWVQSERHRRSVIPVAFWFFSLGGGSVLLIYALYRQDPVFILGQAFGLLIYLRNIYFIIREKRTTRRDEAARLLKDIEKTAQGKAPLADKIARLEADLAELRNITPA